MTVATRSLTGIVTTDLAAVTRGRWVPSDEFGETLASGIGWLPANLSLTPFGTIASPNPWGSVGDLRIIPDPDARYRTSATGAETPFDIVIGNIVELDGARWPCCPSRPTKPCNRSSSSNYSSKSRPSKPRRTSGLTESAPKLSGVPQQARS